MNNSIDAQGNSVNPESNLTEREMGASSRNVDAERIQEGTFGSASTHVPDHVMNNNPDMVQRDGARIHAGGEFQDNDLIRIDGVEMQYSMARDLGMVADASQSNDLTPQEQFQADAETHEEPQDQTLQGVDLIKAQVDLATDGAGDQVLDLVAQDVVVNGAISEEGLAYAKNTLGMDEKTVTAQIDEMTDLGGAGLSRILETGDGSGAERIEFLVDRYEHGSPKEAQAVAALWASVALGRLTDAQVISQFDKLAAPYEV